MSQKKDDRSIWDRIVDAVKGDKGAHYYSGGGEADPRRTRDIVDRLKEDRPRPAPTATARAGFVPMGGVKVNPVAPPGHPQTYVPAAVVPPPTAARARAAPASPVVAAAPVVRAAPGIAANRASTQLLRDLGWTTPDDVQAAYDQGMLDAAAGRDVRGYSYDVDADEMALLADAYKGRAGFIAGRDPGDAPGKVRPGVTRAVPLTWDAYNKLSDDQRRAVDFNTLLLQAREKDLAGQGLPEYDQASYDEQVRSMFGAHGGSHTYAPNTVNLLERVGFSARGQDLDEYLSLDRGVTADELGGFKIKTDDLLQWEWPENLELRKGVDSALDFDLGTPEPRPKSERRTGWTRFLDFDLGGDGAEEQSGAQEAGAPKNRYAESRSAANQLIVDSIAIQRAGAAIDEMMKDPASWGFDWAAASLATGAPPTGRDIPWGWGQTADRADEAGNVLTEEKNKDAIFRTAYGILANPAEDMSRVWGLVDEAGLNDTDVQELFTYFDTKSRKDLASGFVDPALRPTQEIRAMAGLEG